MTERLRLDPAATPEPGKPVALSARVVRMTAPNPGMMTGPGTNSYLVGSPRAFGEPGAGDRPYAARGDPYTAKDPDLREDLIVVDPGPDDAGHVEGLRELGVGRIRWIVVTHTHPDHAPAAAALADQTGAEVIGFGERDGFSPDRSAGDCFEIAGAGFTLRALYTPGHASNHLCWLLAEEAMLFSGDHVMSGSTVVIAPPDGDMAHYLESLRRLLELDPPLSSIAPGHGPLISDPASAVEAVIAHRLWREGLVFEALRAEGRARVDDLVPRVYSDVADRLLPVARFSLWAHLRKLEAEGLVASEDRDDIESLWSF